MPGREYEPKDSRNVTRQQNTPGGSTHWRDKEGATGDSDRGELEPDDSREVTLHQNAPGEPTGWRAKEADEHGARARASDDPSPGATRPADERLAQPEAKPPAGVRQEHPISAEDAVKKPARPG